MLPRGCGNLFAAPPLLQIIILQSSILTPSFRKGGPGRIYLVLGMQPAGRFRFSGLCRISLMTGLKPSAPNLSLQVPSIIGRQGRDRSVSKSSQACADLFPPDHEKQTCNRANPAWKECGVSHGLDVLRFSQSG